MIVEPDYGAAAAAYEEGRAGILRATLVGDLLTPVAAFIRCGTAGGAAFLLESVEGGAVRGRYSMIGLDPTSSGAAGTGRRRSTAGATAPSSRIPPPPGEPAGADRRERDPPPEGLPPMSAGLFGYLGYDMVRAMERLPEPNPDALGVPGRGPDPAHRHGGVRRGARRDLAGDPLRPQAGVPARAAYEGALARLEAVAEALEGPLPPEARPHPVELQVPPALSNTGADAYAAMVARAKEYIAAGDIFQVVLSQRFDAPLPAPGALPLPVLRRVNPSPLPVLPRLRGVPDRLLEPRDPGAGARRRGDDPPHRRNPPAGRHRRGGPGPCGEACWRTRRSGPST
jgi:anthranilate synthase component 1